MKTFFDGIETGVVMAFALALGMFTCFVQLALGVVMLVVLTFFVLTAFLLFALFVFTSLLMISLFVTFVVGGFAFFQLKLMTHFFRAFHRFGMLAHLLLLHSFGVTLFLHHFFHLGEFGLGFFLGDVTAFDGAFDAFFDVLEFAFFPLGLIAFLAALLSD